MKRLLQALGGAAAMIVLTVLAIAAPLTTPASAQPLDPAALRARADSRRENDERELAREDYRQLTELDPDSWSAWFWLATLDRWNRDWGGSISAYGEALRISPCSVDALTGRSRSHRFLSQEALSERDARTALGCSPGNREAVDLLLSSLRRQERWPEAEDLIRSSFEGAERDFRLGGVQERSGRPAKAAQSFERALELEPNNAPAWRHLGAARWEIDRKQPALEAYRRADEIEPDHSETLYWIGLISRRQGLLEEAEAAFDRVLELSPNRVDALLGKARVSHSAGHREAALELTEQALKIRPNNHEALVLHASLLRSLGEPERARRDLRAVLAESPGHRDAQIAMDRLGSRHSWEVSGRSSRSRLIEGLEDAGLISNGTVIRPVRLEYVNEGVAAEVDSRLREGLDLRAALSQTREAIFNLDRGFAIYDFDVARAAAGLDHRLSPLWRLDWRLGGTQYDSRDPGTIADESHFTGALRLRRDTGLSGLSIDLVRAPFIHRGFAGDFQFRIFDRDSVTASYNLYLSPQTSIFATGGVDQYDDGNEESSTVLGLAWQGPSSSSSLRVGRSSIPERFLNDRQELEFVDYDYVSLRGRARLWHPAWALSGEIRRAKYGETPIEKRIGSEIVTGGLRSNSEDFFFGRLQWSPGRDRVFRTGLEYLYTDFEFDTPSYNNSNRSDWSLFVELSKPVADRARYSFRYAHGLHDDERADGYSSNLLAGRFEIRIGGSKHRDRAVWLGLEGRTGANELEEDHRSYRLYLQVPIGARRTDPAQIGGREPSGTEVAAALESDRRTPVVEPREIEDRVLEQAPVPPRATVARPREAAVDSNLETLPDVGTKPLTQLLESWAAAWSQQDVEAYLAFYAGIFTPADGSDRSTWEAQRRVRLSTPRYIEVELSRVETRYPSDHEATVTFSQLYRSDSYSDLCQKTMHFELEAGEWRIRRESAVVLARPAPDDDASLFESVSSMVESWAQAWSAMDLDAYLSHYSVDFVPPAGLTRESWQQQRKNRLAGRQFIRVEIGSLTVRRRDGTEAEFRQIYESDLYNDVVEKLLDLVLDEGGWKISKESSSATL